MSVNFTEAKLYEDAWVYRCPPGDEYCWVTDPEWWDDIDDRVRTVRQRWQLVEEQVVVFHPRTELCPRCEGEGEILIGSDGRALDCGLCRGDGRHPLAGQMEILS